MDLVLSVIAVCIILDIKLDKTEEGFIIRIKGVDSNFKKVLTSIKNKLTGKK